MNNISSTVANTISFKRIRFLMVFLIVGFIGESAYCQLPIGSKAPTIKVTNWVNKEGKAISIKNKYVVLEFWATWCAPCLAALPHMNGLQQQFKDRKNLVFLSITDEKIGKVKTVLPRFQFDSFVVSDTTGSTHNLFDIHSLPATFLIDSLGVVRWSGEPMELTTAVINKFLANDTIVKPVPISTNISTSSDSLNKSYRTFFVDGNIKEAFGMTTPNEQYLGKSVSYIASDVYNSYQIGVKLETLLSKLLHCSESQILLPKHLQKMAISYYFKQNNLSNKKEGEALLLKKISKELNIKLRSFERLQEVLIVTIVDATKLNRAKSSKSDLLKPMGESISYDSTVIAINNGTLESLEKLLKTATNLKVEFNGSEKMTDQYTLTLDNSSFKKLTTSMSYYGIKIVKANRKATIFEFE